MFNVRIVLFKVSSWALKKKIQIHYIVLKFEHTLLLKTDSNVYSTERQSTNLNTVEIHGSISFHNGIKKNPNDSRQSSDASLLIMIIGYEKY